MRLRINGAAATLLLYSIDTTLGPYSSVLTPFQPFDSFVRTPKNLVDPFATHSSSLASTSATVEYTHCIVLSIHGNAEGTAALRSHVESALGAIKGKLFPGLHGEHVELCHECLRDDLAIRIELCQVHPNERVSSSSRFGGEQALGSSRATVLDESKQHQQQQPYRDQSLQQPPRDKRTNLANMPDAPSGACVTDGGIQEHHQYQQQQQQQRLVDPNLLLVIRSCPPFGVSQIRYALHSPARSGGINTATFLLKDQSQSTTLWLQQQINQPRPLLQHRRAPWRFRQGPPPSSGSSSSSNGGGGSGGFWQLPFVVESFQLVSELIEYQAYQHHESEFWNVLLRPDSAFVVDRTSGDERRGATRSSPTPGEPSVEQPSSLESEADAARVGHLEAVADWRHSILTHLDACRVHTWGSEECPITQAWSVLPSTNESLTLEELHRGAFSHVPQHLLSRPNESLTATLLVSWLALGRSFPVARAQEEEEEAIPDGYHSSVTLVDQFDGVCGPAAASSVQADRITVRSAAQVLPCYVVRCRLELEALESVVLWVDANMDNNLVAIRQLRRQPGLGLFTFATTPDLCRWLQFYAVPLHPLLQKSRVRVVTNRYRPHDGGDEAAAILCRTLRTSLVWGAIPIMIFCGNTKPVEYLRDTTTLVSQNMHDAIRFCCCGR